MGGRQDRIGDCPGARKAFSNGMAVGLAYYNRLDAN